MGYAVYHTEKGNVSSGGIGNHIDRVKGKEHTYRHADPERLHLNKNFKVHQDRHNIPLSSAIAERIKEGYKGKRAIRKDAVKYCTHILTGSHEQMLEIFADKEKAQEWINSNYNFIIKEFGKENLVRFSLHLDEKTPHIHAVTVPLTPDGRLSAKEIIGNKKQMQERQDRYAERMQKFGLKRGIRSTGIKHETAREYYARMKESLDNGNDIGVLMKKKKVLGIDLGLDKNKTIEELKQALKSTRVAKAVAEREVKLTKNRLTEVKITADSHKNKLERIINNKAEFTQEREKRLEDAKRYILSHVRISLDYRYNLHKLQKEEREGIAYKLADEGVKKNIHLLRGDLLRELSNDDKFKNQIIEQVERRAEKNLARSQNRRQDKGLRL